LMIRLMEVVVMCNHVGGVDFAGGVDRKRKNDPAVGRDFFCFIPSRSLLARRLF
jgi:hypothetical protein